MSTNSKRPLSDRMRRAFAAGGCVFTIEHFTADSGAPAFQMTQYRRKDNSDWPNWLNVAWNKEPHEIGACVVARREHALPRQIANAPFSEGFAGHVSVIGTDGCTTVVPWDWWITDDLPHRYEGEKQLAAIDGLPTPPVTVGLRSIPEEIITDHRRQILDMQNVRASDGSYVGNWGPSGANQLRWMARAGIFTPMRADPGDNCASIGRATLGKNAGKWVGWSHRAAAAFGIGSTVKIGDCAFVPADRADQHAAAVLWYADGQQNLSITDHDDGLHIEYDTEYDAGAKKGTTFHTSTVDPWLEKWGRGAWTAKTDEDAKQMAIDFANGVS